jgi:AcrR family transcriptional regulator
MNSPDRRVQRTRKSLQDALRQLFSEKGYDAITVQDILDRANVGRATFYAHYQNKEDLFLAHHQEFNEELGLRRWTSEQLLASEPPERLITFLDLLNQNRSAYHVIANSRDANRIWRAMKTFVAANLADSLRSAFGDTTSRIPLDALTEYIASAQLGLIGWWMEQRTPYTARQIAAMLHRLQRAAIQGAFDSAER